MDKSEFRVPQEWVDIPAWIGDNPLWLLVLGWVDCCQRSSANADILYFEDMQDGLLVEQRLTIANPFKEGAVDIKFVL